MSSKKAKENRTHYAAQDTGAKQSRSRRYSVPNAKPKTIGQPKPSAAGRSVRRTVNPKPAFHAATSLDEINQNLLELKADLTNIQQRLAAFEEQLSSLNDAQKRLAAISTIAADELEWLRLSESAFAFWDNSEDDVYDTL